MGLETKINPRHQCQQYFNKNKAEAVLLPKDDFDKNAKSKLFAEGPFIDSFGDGYGEPYNPNRQAFGKLLTGEYVYCELNKASSKSENLEGNHE